MDEKKQKKMKGMIIGFAIYTALFICPIKAWGTRIVIDAYHYGDWPIENESADFASELRAAGYEVIYHYGSITEASLSTCDVFVEFFPVDSVPITMTEATTLRGWVEEGHGLFMGAGFGNVLGVADELNKISQPWDVVFNSDSYDGSITDIAAHPVTADVDIINLDLSCSITGGLSLAKASDGATILTVAEPGMGRVIFLGDSLSGGIFHNGTIYHGDNLALALNSGQWLAPEPATVLLLGLGSLSLMYRRRK